MVRAKDSLSDIIGKTISSVVVAENRQSEPRVQVFLVFSDNTSFEIWSNDKDLSVASGVDKCDKDRIIEVLKNRQETQIWTFESDAFNLAMTQQDLLSPRDT